VGSGSQQSVGTGLTEFSNVTGAIFAISTSAKSVDQLLADLIEYPYLTERIEMYREDFGGRNDKLLRTSLEVLNALMPIKAGFLWHGDTGEIVVQFRDSENKLHRVQFKNDQINLANRDKEYEVETIDNFRKIVTEICSAE